MSKYLVVPIYLTLYFLPCATLTFPVLQLAYAKPNSVTCARFAGKHASALNSDRDNASLMTPNLDSKQVSALKFDSEQLSSQRQTTTFQSILRTDLARERERDARIHALGRGYSREDLQIRNLLLADILSAPNPPP